MNFDLSNAVFHSAGTRKRDISVVSSSLTRKDVIDGWKARWGFGRSSYRVSPGLYACGAPTPESPVLVTANYKLSFDSLRKELSGVAVWLLVLDTGGVNVWCASGKGSFGTAELLRRVDAVRLESVVSHRVLVLPQLGAVGVSAHEFSAASPFRIVYGPVSAADIPAFLAAGMRKDDAMARVRFDLADRIAVAPIETIHAWPALAAAVVFAALQRIFSGAYLSGSFAQDSLVFASPILIGTLAFPALLPLLPFRPFALKGAVLGAAWSVGLAAVLGWEWATAVPFGLVATSAVSFFAMNFTGSSTYTNLSGAALEVKVGLPFMAVAFIAGVAVALFCRG